MWLPFLSSSSGKVFLSDPDQAVWRSFSEKGVEQAPTNDTIKISKTRTIWFLVFRCWSLRWRTNQSHMKELVIAVSIETVSRRSPCRPSNIRFVIHALKTGTCLTQWLRDYQWNGKCWYIKKFKNLTWRERTFLRKMQFWHNSLCSYGVQIKI